MLYISKEGYVYTDKIKMKIFATIERGKMDRVNGIVVHQTDSSTAESTFNSYKNKGANGAHFLIDKDGTIYQTASLYQVTNHVGKMQSRCYKTHECAPTEFKRMSALEKAWKPSQISEIERKKKFPDRYPFNTDAIGIEIVGKSRPDPGQKEKITYDQVNEAQNASLKWLVRELSQALSVSMTEIYRHSDVARKTEAEASTARW